MAKRGRRSRRRKVQHKQEKDASDKDTKSTITRSDKTDAANEIHPDFFIADTPTRKLRSSGSLENTDKTKLQDRNKEMDASNVLNELRIKIRFNPNTQTYAVNSKINDMEQSKFDITEDMEALIKKVNRFQERRWYREHSKIMETDEQRKKRLAYARNYNRFLRLCETNEMREKRLENARRYRERRKPNETEHEHEQRLARIRYLQEKRKRSRAKGRKSKILIEQEKRRLYRIKAKERETEEQRIKRIEYNRRYQKKGRNEETIEQRYKRLEYQRAYRELNTARKRKNNRYHFMYQLPNEQPKDDENICNENEQEYMEFIQEIVPPTNHNIIDLVSSPNKSENVDNKVKSINGDVPFVWLTPEEIFEDDESLDDVTECTGPKSSINSWTCIETEVNGNVICVID